MSSQLQITETILVDGEPDYAGWTWCCHHDIRLEWCYSFRERWHYITTNKPACEQETRKRWFRPVVGNVPDALSQARQARDQAQQAYYQAHQACNQAQQAYCQAQQARNQARQAYYQAHQAYYQVLTTFKPEMLSLAAIEQPDCPWFNNELLMPKE